MRRHPERRAKLVARMYPRQWRRRYPDFVDLLAIELAEHPRGVVRDVAKAAVAERLQVAGILATGSKDRARSGLALIYAALVPFVALAMGMWSQLRTGLTAQGPTAPPILRAAEVLLEVGTLVALACLPLGIGLSLVRARRRDRSPAGAAIAGAGRRWVRPAAVLTCAVAALTVTGWAADQSRWYSPAASALPARGPAHSLTLWIRALIAPITPAWMHPGILGRMPAGEVAAVLLAPLLGLVAAAALLRTIMALPLHTPGRTDMVVGVSAVGMMLLAAAASVRWLLTHPGPRGATPLLAHRDQLAPGHTGWAVVVLLAAMAFTALVGTRRMLRGRSQRPPESADGLPYGATSQPVASAREASAAARLLFADQ